MFKLSDFHHKPGRETWQMCHWALDYLWPHSHSGDSWPRGSRWGLVFGPRRQGVWGGGAGQGRLVSEPWLWGWLCLWSCQSRCEAPPLGHGPPGRWENNSSFCQCFQGQRSDRHQWELEPASRTHPIPNLNRTHLQPREYGFRFS